MGNSSSSTTFPSSSTARNYLCWGALLLLVTPLPTNNVVFGLSIPNYFGGRESSVTSSDTNNEAVDNIIVSVPSEDEGSISRSRSSSTSTILPRLSAIVAPMIGPADAPHLRYIPSYLFSPSKLRMLLPKIISQLHVARSTLLQILWYKPPVGIVGAFSFLRIFERLYGVVSPPLPSSGEEALADAEGQIEMVGNGGNSGIVGKMYQHSTIQTQQQMQKLRKKRRKQVRYGRSLDLDGGDRLYSIFGGIETVRVRACQEGLRCALSLVLDRGISKSTSLTSRPCMDGSNNNKNSENGGKSPVLNGDAIISPNVLADVKIAINSLMLSCPPKGSRAYFVEQSIEALSALSKYYYPTSHDAIDKKDTESSSIVCEQNIFLLLRHSSKLIEIRALDALLRTLRDRHLMVSARLRRTCDYWKWHVNLSGGRLGQWMDTIQALAQKLHLSWARHGVLRDQNQQVFEIVTATWERELDWLGRVEKLLLERPAELHVSELLSVVSDSGQRKYSSFLGSFATNRKELNGEHLTLDCSLSKTVQYLSQPKNRMWLKQTEVWSQKVRSIIKESLGETIRSSFTPISKSAGEMMRPETSDLYTESKLLELWAHYDNSASDAYSWLTVLTLVDCSASVKRSGERRHFQLSNIASIVRQYDFLRIPSSALFLAAANSIHDNIIAPHQQEILDFIKSIFVAIWGIVEFRFYTPMKDILLDLLNRRPRMVDPFALLNEQTSLDNMLRDLGVGDGTLKTRATALAAASRIYEQEVSGGAIRGIIKGRVPQLMLIQIQQLKADLLQAMDQIDNLIDANRLNVQLVASIPALLIIIFGTRALFLFWSNIRMKDFRLPRTVHAEMSDYLKRVEECLVLSNYQHDATATVLTQTEVHRSDKGDSCLGPKEMGQLLLLLHSYLNLLDYMSPPFPGKTCDSIHSSVQNLLHGQMNTSRQLGLLKVIQSKHDDLIKSF